MSILIAGLILFLGVHSVSIVGSSWRAQVIEKIGEMPWKGIYSLLSIAGFALIVWGYGLARQTPVIVYIPPIWLRHVALLLLIAVFPLLLAAYFPGRIKAITKHPMLAAIKIWAFAHLLVLFGSFLIWSVADRISMKYREPRDIPEARASKANDAIAVVGGLGLYVVFSLWLHQWLFGVPPIGP